MNKAKEPSQSPIAEVTEIVEASTCHFGCLIEFSYVWNIENFTSVTSSMAVGVDLQSPMFAPRGFDTMTWRLKLYPQGTQRKYTSVGLWLCETNTDMLQAFLDLSVTNANNAKVPINSNCEKSGVFTPYQSMVLAGHFDIKSGGLLVGDNLTIVCAISVLNRMHHPLRDVFKTLPRFKLNHTRILHYDRLLADPLYSDLTIVVNDREIPAHRNILAARSDVFATIIARIEKNSETPHKMNLTNISYEACQKMLHFIYCGNVTNIADHATELLLAANKFDIVGLKALCEENLVPTISVDNVVKLLRISCKINAIHLKRGLADFITDHAQQLEDNVELREVMRANPDFILQALWVSTKKRRTV